MKRIDSSWFELGEHLNSVDSEYKDVAVEKHAERWTYGHAAVSAAAYVLDPEFHSQALQGYTTIFFPQAQFESKMKPSYLTI